MITRKELIKKYIEFFKNKNHKEIHNASLIPENDPTVLFNTAGMQPLIPYLSGEGHPQGKRLANVQKCIRTVDIEDVGDTYHHTFFEMLGNWSLGDYWKEEAIKMTYEFLTEVLKIPKERLAFTCFEGDKKIPKDTESENIYLELGIPKKRIAFLDKSENFWGPPGKTGPCGPNTEVFYWKLKDKEAPKEFNPDDENWLEIGNNVLLNYYKNDNEKYEQLKQKNIDFGGGVERMVIALNEFEDNYEADMWKPIIKRIEKVSGKRYSSEENKKHFRIIADHIKASAFIIADGINPSNSEQGYVLRRLIRRAIRHGKILGIEKFVRKISEPVFEIYDDYELLEKNKTKIFEELEKEEQKFLQTLEKGIKIFEKINSKLIKENKKHISGKDAFLLYQSYGFPLEMTQELAKENQLEVNSKEFEKEFNKHQELSRIATEGKFKSGLADESEKTKKLHTATHLLNQALREVLKNQEIFQKGSNITPERLRFDFNFDRKLTKEEIQKVEDWVNEKVKEGLPVRMEEVSLEKAKEMKCQGIFEDKYKNLEKIKIYLIGEKGKEISKEICAGPHVQNTNEIGKFKIKKEESSSAGVRRIKAVVE